MVVVRSDEELMIAYVAGDASAFRELFQRYATTLTRVLARQLRAPEVASDLVQQTFLQLHRARFDFDARQRFKPWIFTIALNLKREYFRRSRRRPEHPLELSPAAEPAVPARGAARWEAQRDLAGALEQIRAEQREVIELHWFAGLSFAEIAESMGLTTNAVKVRAHRGYVALRAALERGPPARGGSRNPEEGSSI
jgi:RNA polymerase sigma-70 factor, ECF subfamily